ncbi:MAG: hypothetical protein RJA22_1713 [Verrucomicrobiota bacterium]|jgi:hypothetical protein
MKRLLSPAFGLLLAAVLPLAAAPVPPAEKLLAQDTLFVLTFPDFHKAKDSWLKSSMGGIWQDESMRPFRDKLTGKLKSAVAEPLEKELGIKFADYTGLAQGQLTFAITTPKPAAEGERAAPGLLVLLDARDKADSLKTTLSDVKKKWVDGGKQLKTEKIREVEFTTFIFKSDELGKVMEKVFPDPKAGFESLDEPKAKRPARTVELMVGQSDSLLVIGNTAKDIEKVLAAQAGGGVATLSEVPAFSRSQNTLFRDANSYGWLHLKPLLDLAVKAFSRGPNDPNDPAAAGMFPKPDKILAALGLTSIQALAFNTQTTPDGDMLTFQVAGGGERRGLLKALSFEAKDANPPAFVPANAVKFTRVRVDLNKAWTTIESSLTEAVPQMASIFKMVLENAGKDKDPNFDLRKQFFDNLGDDVITYERAPTGQTLEDLQSPPSLILISSPRAEQMAASMKALTSLLPTGGGKVKEREFLGRKVYSMSVPAMQPGGRGSRSLSYAASGGYVVFSSDTAMLEEFMRSSDGAGKALRDAPGLSDAAQKVGGMNTGLFGYENQAETFKTTFETLKKDSASLGSLFAMSAVATRLSPEGQDGQLKDWVDFSLLPPFERIAKYLGISVWSGSLSGEGFTLKYFTPTPAGMKK